MEQIAITTQPLPSSQNTEKLSEPSTEVSTMHSNDDTGRNIEKENEALKTTLIEPLTEVTATFNSDSVTSHYQEKENSEDEKEKSKQQRREDASDCCCVYVGDSDPFFTFYLCHWICECFRDIGTATDNCFEDCASCISNCCEDGNGDSSCFDCCSCDDSGEGCGDCLTGCLECCSIFSCDCSSN